MDDAIWKKSQRYPYLNVEVNRMHYDDAIKQWNEFDIEYKKWVIKVNDYLCLLRSTVEINDTYSLLDKAVKLKYSKPMEPSCSIPLFEPGTKAEHAVRGVCKILTCKHHGRMWNYRVADKFDRQFNCNETELFKIRGSNVATGRAISESSCGTAEVDTPAWP